MNALLLDTHAWAWSLTGDAQLSEKAISAMLAAESVFVSPISLFEIGQKVRIGKWPQMQPHVENLPALLERQGGRVASLTPQISLQAAMMVWEHRDPFDRILAATAFDLGVPLISADAVFDTMPGLNRIW